MLNTVPARRGDRRRAGVAAAEGEQEDSTP